MPRVLPCTVSSLRQPGEPLVSADLAARVDEKIMRPYIENSSQFPSHPSPPLTHDQHVRLRQAGNLARLLDPNNERMLPARPDQPLNVTIIHRDGNALAVRLATPLPPPGADEDAGDVLLDSGIILPAADTLVTREQWHQYLRAQVGGPAGVSFLATCMPRDVMSNILARRDDLMRLYGPLPCEASSEDSDSEQEEEDEDDSSDVPPPPAHAPNDSPSFVRRPASLPHTPAAAAALPPTPIYAASQPPTPAATSLPPTPAAARPRTSLPPTPAAAPLPSTLAAAEPARANDSEDESADFTHGGDGVPDDDDDDDDDVPISAAKRACVAAEEQQKAVPAAPASTPRKRKPAARPAPPAPAERPALPPATEEARQLLLFLNRRVDKLPEVHAGLLLRPASRAAGLVLARRLEAARRMRLAAVVRGLVDDRLRLSPHSERNAAFGGRCDLAETTIGPTEHGIYVWIGSVRLHVAERTERWLRGIDAMLHFDRAVLARHRPTNADFADDFAATAAALTAEHAARIDAVYA